ncbi:type II secretion system protein GspJ [Sphingomonas sp. 37zxx]|uniref:type II secretion system protein GspJ n=1 Tax=Sphingomonas sp. 37zxx TaxID=1550073 RepID=UPI003FA78795
MSLVHVPGDANCPAASGRGEAGFTLLELMISLGLFALIAVAGLALVDSVLGVQVRTATRLDSLSNVSRAMFVVSSDLEQIARGRVVSNGRDLIFTRVAPGFGGPPVEVRYTLAGGTLLRSIGGAPQRLLSGVTAAHFRFEDGGWRAGWPLSEEAAEDWPRAIEMELGIEGRGTLRRVVALPARPEQAP